MYCCLDIKKECEILYRPYNSLFNKFSYPVPSRPKKKKKNVLRTPLSRAMDRELFSPLFHS